MAFVKVRVKQHKETLHASSNNRGASGNLSLKQTRTDVPPSVPDRLEGEKAFCKPALPAHLSDTSGGKAIDAASLPLRSDMR